MHVADVDLPEDWSKDDLENLARSGAIKLLNEVNGNFMPDDYWAYYRIVVKP